MLKVIGIIISVIKAGIASREKATEMAVSMSIEGIKYEKHNKS